MPEILIAVAVSAVICGFYTFALPYYDARARRQKNASTNPSSETITAKQKASSRSAAA